MIRKAKFPATLMSLLVLTFLFSLRSAQAADQVALGAQESFKGVVAQSLADSGAADQSISSGTRITKQNWLQYHRFMSDGLQALFAGKYFWKMPGGAQINLGPTIINPPPPSYVEATEKYAGQVKLVDLPNGGLTLENYKGGAPFPKPEEPHKGWKILADLWYRYFPSTSVIMHGGGCSIDRAADINCTAGDIVYRQLNYNTDPGVPMAIDGGADKFYTQWYMLVEPEQQRYTASLQIVHSDLQKDEDIYAFVPALRRYQRVSTLGRCSMVSGVDITEEDYRSGFDSNLTATQSRLFGR